MAKTWTELLWSCIAYPCTEDRVVDSAFCDQHHKDWKKSPYPAQLRAAIEINQKAKKR